MWGGVFIVVDTFAHFVFTLFSRQLSYCITEMILDAAETVLEYFGFDRTVYGNKKNTRARKWKWLQDLKREIEQDINVETMESNDAS